MISIDKLLNKLFEHKIEILAGKKGVLNELVNIDVQEFPLKSKRVTEKSLILSTFIGYKNDYEIIDQFKWYIDIGISAMGVHTVHNKKIPEIMINLANEKDIPVFSIPRDVPYHMIYNAFLDVSIEQQLQIHKDIEENFDLMLKGLMLGKGTQFTKKTLEKYIGQNTVLLDVWKSNQDIELFKYQYNFSENESIKFDELCLLQQNLQDLSPFTFNVSEYHFVIFSIYSNEDFFAYLVIEGTDFEKDDRLQKVVIKNAVNVIALEYAQKKQRDSYNYSRDILLVEEILLNLNDQRIPYDRFNCNFEAFTNCAILLVTNTKKFNSILGKVQKKLKSQNSSLSLIYENHILIFTESKSQIDELRKYIGDDVFIGLRDAFNQENVNKLKNSIEDAIKAAKVAQVLNKGLCSWEDISIEILFLELMTNPSKPYENLPYFKLIQSHYDEVNSEVWETVIVYFEQNFSFKESSKLLHLHPNTVKYRVKKLEERLEINLNSNIESYNILFALKLINFKRDYENVYTI